MLNILYYGGGWPTNIGNAFIDLGAIAILKMAAPDSRIFFASEMPRWFLGHSSPKQTFVKSINFRSWQITLSSKMMLFDSLELMDQALDVASVTKCDLIVFSGMAMCEEFVRVNGPSILTLSRQQCPVLLLGTGASIYSDEERKVYGEFLRQINPVAFISRDDRSYEMFAEYVSCAHKGIDCAFFLPEAYSPPTLMLPPYVVMTFDSMWEPDLDLRGRLLVRAHHACWGPVKRDFIHPGITLISDIPHDYLAIYANADEVHSDRVHACIAALAYGKRARLYHPTARGSLFDAVGAHDVRETLTQLDTDILAELKQTQVDQVKKVIAMQVQSRNGTSTDAYSE